MKQIVFAILALAMVMASAQNTPVVSASNTATVWPSSWANFNECNNAFNLGEYKVYEPLDFSGVSKHPIPNGMKEAQLEDNYCAETAIVGGIHYVVMPRGSKAICHVNKNGSIVDCTMRADCHNTIYRMSPIQPLPPAQAQAPPQKQVVVPAGAGPTTINIYQINNNGGESGDNGGNNEQASDEPPSYYGVTSYTYAPPYYIGPVIWWGGFYWGWGDHGYTNFGHAFNYAWRSGGPGYGRGGYGYNGGGNRGGNGGGYRWGGQPPRGQQVVDGTDHPHPTVAGIAPAAASVPAAVDPTAAATAAEDTPAAEVDIVKTSRDERLSQQKILSFKSIVSFQRAHSNMLAPFLFAFL